MDGNGRWARERGLKRIKGHEEGSVSVRTAMQSCRDHGVKYLTLYAFSTENWLRPRTEVTGLMALLHAFLIDNEWELHENQVRFRAMGRLNDLPKKVRTELDRVSEATKHYDRWTINLALSYGGRTELTDAVQEIARKVEAGTLKSKNISEKTIASHLYAPDIPDPDLMIRTSGEMRLSNFLLWQVSYSEIYVTDVNWPDFREAEFTKAMESYKARDRRYGGVKS